MPIYDRRCNQCGVSYEDAYEAIDVPNPPCSCGGTMERVWTGHGTSVIPDEIPGGIDIKHGLCYPDGTPKRYYSRSEIAREAKRRGLTNHVEHIGGKGSDKSKHTSRWV